jgi:branched-chain amino acid transport system substrate-binding protein
VRDGVVLAVEEINATAGSVHLEPDVKDDGTVAAGQYDPPQSAANARDFAADNDVMAVIGPITSGSARAMEPIASQAHLPLLTPSSTEPSLTDPQFATQYRPGGKPVLFRMVTTDAYQGPNTANYAR